MSAAGCVLLCLSSLLAASGQDAAVESGRRALSRTTGSYPWYDARTDGVRPIQVSPPRDPMQLPDFDLSSLRGIFTGLAWLILAILLGALIYFLIRTAMNREAESETKSASGEEDRRRSEALPLPADAPQGNLLALTRENYAAGRYAQAIIYLFSHQLAELDRRHRIRLSKGKTNRQYLRELGSHDTLRRLVEQTMVAFEDVFFGHRNLDRARFETCWSRLGEFEAMIAEGAA